MFTSFVTPYNLTRIIQVVECTIPGWWWSISQKQGEVFFNTGPGRKCPHEPDNIYATSKEGDNGSSVTIKRDLVKLEEAIRRDGSLRYDGDVKTPIYNHIKSFNEVREITCEHLLATAHSHRALYRYQSIGDLELLCAVYRKLVETDLPLFELGGYSLEEIYIGSCDFSADCSLRGKRSDGTDFDVTVDLQGTATIDESVATCVDELNAEILTYKP